MPDVRMPTQARAIKKRDLIIKKGFELMCKEGYHNTNTTEIGKYAGVSTGIIYQYFNDKKEIFIEGTKRYLDSHITETCKLIDKNNNLDIDKFFKSLIEFVGSNYLKKASVVHQLTAMEFLYPEIKEIMDENKVKYSNKLYEYLTSKNVNKKSLVEKIHIIMRIIDSIAHDYILFKNDKKKYNKIEDYTISIINELIKK